MDILQVIKDRRSIREFNTKPISHDALASILEAGRWAPSGLNNQPWRFVIIQDEKMRFRLADLTKYSSILMLAPTAIAVFMDTDASYSRQKDLLAIGACIQNMLLEAYTLGFGACWLGEILNNAQKVTLLLEVPKSYELQAVLAIGHPKGAQKEGVPKRMDLKDLVFGSWPLD